MELVWEQVLLLLVLASLEIFNWLKMIRATPGIAITGCLGGVTEAAGVTIGGINAVGSGETINELGGKSISTSGEFGLPVPISPVVGGSISIAEPFNRNLCGDGNIRQGAVTKAGFLGVAAGFSFVDIGTSICTTKIISID